jgi:hypothetical protein
MGLQFSQVLILVQIGLIELQQVLFLLSIVDYLLQDSINGFVVLELTGVFMYLQIVLHHLLEITHHSIHLEVV